MRSRSRLHERKDLRRGTRLRISERWDEFVLEGVGVRCVSDRPWVTAAETAECVMALDAVGLVDDAHTLLAWTRQQQPAVIGSDGPGLFENRKT